MKNIFSSFSQHINGVFQAGDNNSISINGSVVNGVTINGAKAEPAGPVASKEVTIYPFSKLDAGGAFDITIRLGDAPKLTFTAEERVLPYLEAYLQGDHLELATTGQFSTSEPLKVDLVVTSLTAIDLSGACKLVFEDVAGVRLQLDVSGAANVKLAGTVGRLEVDASGAANVRCHKLRATEVQARVSGAANVRAYADTTVKVDASGAAKFELEGSPSQRQVRQSGAASIDIE
jgi:hypothetical protein